MSSKSKIATKLPYLQLGSAFAVQFSEAMNINVLFPFLAFMVESLGHGGPKLGYYAGGLAAAFCGAQFLSAVTWGVISDRYGRRSAMVLGSFGTGIGMLVFGFSTTYTQAVLGRFLSGLLCGNVGVLKSFLNEVTDETNRGSGFAMLSLAWAFGTIVAPLVGGTLSKPSEKYDLLRNVEIFQHFPYLLPCLVCVFFNWFAALFCYAVMTETRKFHSGNATNSGDTTSSSTMYSELHASSSLDESRHAGFEKESEVELAPMRVEGSIEGSPLHGGDFSAESAHGLLLVSQGDDSKLDQSSTQKACDVNVKIPTNIAEPIKFDTSPISELSDIEEGPHRIRPLERTQVVDMSEQRGLDSDDEEDHEHILACCFAKYRNTNRDAIVDIDGDKLGMTGDSSSHIRRKKIQVSLFFRKSVVVATGTYGLLCMSYILLDETLPLFLKLDLDQGGLSFGSNDIGLLLSTSGVFMIFFTGVVLPTLASMNKARLFLIATIGGIPTTFAWPFLAVLYSKVLSHWGKEGDQVLWVLLILACVLKNVFACMAFTAVMLQVNDSCDSCHLGAVNGLGQSLGALARAIGPAIGGVLWSVTIMNHFVFTNFIGCALILFICQCLNFYLPKIKKSPPNGLDDEQEVVFNEMGGM